MEDPEASLSIKHCTHCLLDLLTPSTLTHHRYVYDEIKARVASGETEAGVLNALQERLSALTPAPRGGRGRQYSKANWAALVAELRTARPRAASTRTGEVESEEEEGEA